MNDDMKPSDKIIDRIQKLLALGSNNPNANEAEVAMKRAHALLAKYNLSLADMTEKERTASDPYEHGTMLRKERFRSYMRIIAHAIAKLYFCSLFYTRFTNYDTYTFVGRKSNIAIAQMVADSVIAQMVALAKAGSGGNAGWQTNFMDAASRRIAMRCAQLIKEAEEGKTQDEGGRNLPALRNTYLAEQQGADDYIANEMKTKLREKKSLAKGGRGGYEGSAAGDRAGSEVSLRPGVSDKRKRDAIGGAS